MGLNIWDAVFSALDVIADKDLFPFAIDSFGNYICLNLRDGEVVFWDHETGRINTTEKNLGAFIDNLY